MAINKNHEFEDLEGVKCAIVERNASPERVAFLKKILEFNNYTTVTVKSPPPKAAAVKAISVVPATVEKLTTDDQKNNEIPTLPETFTIGVTDVMFNATNAIFGRLLKTENGHIVTLAYWDQLEEQAHDEIPYYESKAR